MLTIPLASIHMLVLTKSHKTSLSLSLSLSLSRVHAGSEWAECVDVSGSRLWLVRVLFSNFFFFLCKCLCLCFFVVVEFLFCFVRIVCFQHFAGKHGDSKHDGF